MPRDGSPTLTPEQIRAAGEALYGPAFVGPLSRALGHTEDRKLRNWLDGQTPRDAETVAADLRRLLVERQAMLREALRVLR